MQHQGLQINRVTLENFRAFRGERVLDFGGRNALIWGENGSGKSSVWTALDAFFQASLQTDEADNRASFDVHRYQFNDETGRVELEILDEERHPLTNSTWSASHVPFDEQIKSAARVRACLNYRALEKVHILHRETKEVDVWPLLLDTLLPYVDITEELNRSIDYHIQQADSQWADSSKFQQPRQKNYLDSAREATREFRTIQASWKAIKTTLNSPQPNMISPSSFSYAQAMHEAYLVFKRNLEGCLHFIKQDADEMLSHLSSELKFEWKIRLDGSPLDNPMHRSMNPYVSRLADPQIILSVLLHGQKIDNYHNLLNEARLSALSLAVYLAGAKFNANRGASSLKVMALDDVLIGLDMSNRMPLLKILDEHFSDWQIFLFTYDRAWYELAKGRLGEEHWKHFEFYAGGEVPVGGEDCGALEKSKVYLQAARDLKVPDYKAAGVWARSAFEWMMKWFCDKYNVPVIYRIEEKKLSAGTLWRTLKTLQVEIPGKQDESPKIRRLIHKEMAAQVGTCKAEHLNPLCHANLNQFERNEIEESVEALRVLDEILRFDYKSVSVAPLENPDEPPSDVNNWKEWDLPGFSNTQFSKLAKKVEEEKQRRINVKLAESSSSD